MELNHTLQNASVSDADAVVRAAHDASSSEPTAAPPRFALAGALIAAVTHDLRQPLTAIEMNVSAAIQLLQRSTPAIDDAITALTDALAQEHRMRDAVQLLHDLAARRSPRREACDILAAIRDVLALVRSDALTRHVDIELEASEPPPAAIGDDMFIRHALFDILLEGLESSTASAAQPASIQVAVRRVGNTAEIAMTHANVPAPTLGGTQWELPLARSIVAMHGGTLAVVAAPSGGVLVTTAWPLFDDLNPTVTV